MFVFVFVILCWCVYVCRLVLNVLDESCCVLCLSVSAGFVDGVVSVVGVMCCVLLLCHLSL